MLDAGAVLGDPVVLIGEQLLGVVDLVTAWDAGRSRATLARIQDARRAANSTNDFVLGILER